MSGAIRDRERAAQISTAARTITQRAPVTLTLVRHRAQPTAETVVRLTVTAVFAYLLALLIPSTPRPVLAPLTALLVVQVSIYQTLRSGVRRVASVVAGVLLALGLSAWVGFTWWSLGIAIALGLAVGYALHLREEVLEVPISAMLILSVGTRSAATGRIVETFIGTAAGLVAGFVLTSPRVQPAEEAIEELCGTMAGLLDQMAAGLRAGPVQAAATGWLAQARSLGTEIQRVDDALRQAEESTKLNPRSLHGWRRDCRKYLTPRFPRGAAGTSTILVVLACPAQISSRNRGEPAPVLARLERLDDRVPDGEGVSPRVPERRRVAAAHVPAGQAQAQVHPLGPQDQAFLAAARRPRRHRADQAQVRIGQRRHARRPLVVRVDPMLGGEDRTHISRPGSFRAGPVAGPGRPGRSDGVTDPDRG